MTRNKTQKYMHILMFYYAVFWQFYPQMVKELIEEAITSFEKSGYEK